MIFYSFIKTETLMFYRKNCSQTFLYLDTVEAQIVCNEKAVEIFPQP